MIFFSYHIYLWYGCIIPLIILIAGIFLLLSGGYQFLKKRKSSTELFLKKNVFLTFLLRIVPVILCVIAVLQLKNGFPLLWDREDDAQLVAGRIVQIDEVKHSPRYIIQGKSVTRASLIMLDSVSEPLYIMNADGLFKGQYLAVKYLPSSKVVLGYGDVSTMELLKESKGTDKDVEKFIGNSLFIILFSCVMFLMLYIKHKKTTEKKNCQSSSDLELFIGNEIRIRSNKKQQVFLFALSGILVTIGIIGILAFQAPPGILFIGLGFLFFFQGVTENRFPVLIYDENGIMVYTIHGKCFRYSYADLTIECIGEGTDSLVDVSYMSKFMGRTFVEHLKLESSKHIGIQKFIAFLEEHSIPHHR